MYMRLLWWRWLPSPETTVQDGLSTFVTLEPLNVFQEKTGHIFSHYVATKLDDLDETSRQFPAMFVAIEPGGRIMSLPADYLCQYLT